MRVDPEYLEHSGNEKRIERRFPRRRPGDFAEWIAEALTLGQGAPDAAHFPAEAEVVVNDLNL